MKKKISAVLLALSCLMAAQASQAQSLQQINAIEREYARVNRGAVISDAQLEYYLDRSNSGWSMNQISADMAAASRNSGANWRPAPGWVAREVVCSSIDNRYRECNIPFRGTAMITAQVSSSPCIEGRTWGQKPGAVWVNNGCRARFGVVRTTPAPNNRVVVCQSNRGRYRECPTGIRGNVLLSRRLNNSAACIEGRTWGQKPGVVWVSRGCRAEFASIGRPGPRDDGNWDRNYAVTCASTDRNQVRCNWNERYGRPRLDRQLSQSACVEGRSWGYDRGDLWVSNGCRARFVTTQTRAWDGNGRGDYDRRDDRGDNGWMRDNNYSVECNSTGGGRTVCTWDDRYGRPRISQQLSQSACVEGRDWGYDRRGELWVTAGCRARFGFR